MKKQEHFYKLWWLFYIIWSRTGNTIKKWNFKIANSYLRSFWDANKRWFLSILLSLDNFRDIVGKTESYLKYYDLKRYVIEDAIAEINKKHIFIISSDMMYIDI